MSENENIGYYMPNKGTNIWCDAMVIPQSSKHVDLAHEFINYVSVMKQLMVIHLM